MLAKQRIIFYFVAFVFTFFIAAASHVSAQTLIVNENGQLYLLYPLGSVLGEEDKKDEEKKEEKQEERKEEKKEEKRKEKKEEKFEQTIEVRSGMLQRKIEIRNGQYQEEVRDAAGKRKINIEDGKLEIRIKPADGVDDESEDEIEDKAEESTPSAHVERVRVRQVDDIELTPASGSGVEIRRGRVKARANFPLTVSADNELIVTTPAGSKVVTVLPDAAVANLISLGIVSQVATSAESPSQEVDLTAEGGKLEYKVSGIKDVKFLGLIPIAAPIEARVSAETGVVTSVNQPFFLNLFGFLFR